MPKATQSPLDMTEDEVSDPGSASSDYQGLGCCIFSHKGLVSKMSLLWDMKQGGKSVMKWDMLAGGMW